MASATSPAIVGPALSANTEGPDPDMLHPKAPAPMAAALSAWKCGMRPARCGSMTLSSNDRLNRDMSDSYIPMMKAPRLAVCRTNEAIGTSGRKISLASRVNTFTCGYMTVA
ncbi:MAG: hypothetical protein RLY31_1831 [Bacteroidota bacterium]